MKKREGGRESGERRGSGLREREEGMERRGESDEGREKKGVRKGQRKPVQH